MARRHASSRERPIFGSAFLLPFHFTSTCLTVTFGGSPLKRAREALAVARHASAAALSTLGAALAAGAAAASAVTAGGGAGGGGLPQAARRGRRRIGLVARMVATDATIARDG